MKSVVDRRETGIPGSDASEYVERMGGPVAQRTSRKHNQDGPVPLSIGKTNGSSNARARQDAIEEPLATDVLPENSDGEDNEWQEWKPRRSSRAEVRRRLAEQHAHMTGDKPVAVPERATRARHRTDDLPHQRQRRRLHGGVVLLLGALALIALYLLIGWLYSAGLGVSNRLSYGPTPTAYLNAVVGDHDAPGHPTSFVAMNVHGTIVIQVAPGGDFVKSSTDVLTTLDPHAWGNVDDVIVTLQVQGGGPTPNVIVRLQGDPDLSHFLVRPGASFLLLNQLPGFRIGPYVLQ